MTYDSKYNKQKEEYRKEKFKRVGIDFDKDYYNKTLKPFADANNLPVGTLIKQCIDSCIPDSGDFIADSLQYRINTIDKAVTGIIALLSVSDYLSDTDKRNAFIDEFNYLSEHFNSVVDIIEEHNASE